MVKATGERYGISGGLAPLKVVEPALTQTGFIEQSTPVSGASNVITVTLTSNYHLKNGTGAAAAKVTISGLTGTQNSASPAVTSCNSSALGTSGTWNQTTGTLVLTATADINSGVACVITITVTNPSSDQ